MQYGVIANKQAKREKRKLYWIILHNSVFLLIASLFSIAAQAQYRAGLQGTVTDTQGAVIPDANVKLVDKETNQTQETKTNAGGTYTFNRLAPAPYSIQVSKAGFATKTVNEVQIAAEQMQSLNVQLAISGTNQTVTVTDTAPAIDTETGNLASTISARQLQNMPSANRDPYQLLRLVPGTTGDSSEAAGGGSYSLPGNGGIGGSQSSTSIFSVENRPQSQANGQRTSANSFQIDGSEVNSLAWGGGAVITPNEESVKEVQVQTSPYDATNGRNSGAQVLVVSRNGTNQWHGSAMIKIHRPGLDAYQPYNGPNAKPQRDENRFNQEAGSIGGPIWKDHAFFFFSYETIRLNSQKTGNGWYETPNFDNLIASANNGSIASAITGYKGEAASYSSISTVPTCASAGISSKYCQKVTVNGVTGLDVGSPLKTGLGKADPSYINAGQPGFGSGLDGIPDLFFINEISPNNSKQEQYNGRLDWQVTPSDLVAYTVYWVPTENTSYNGPIRAANLWHSNHLSYSHAFLYNHIFSPSLLNEFRLNAVRWYWNELATNPQAPFGLPEARFDTIGNLSNNSNSATNTAVQDIGGVEPTAFAQTTYNIRDTVTKTWRSHNIRVGFDGYSERDNDNELFSTVPSYQFRNLWDFANDAPYSEGGNFDPLTGKPTGVLKHIRSSIYAGYLQDDWRIRPNLTMNLGLRWEYFGPITESNNNISNVVFGSGANTLVNARMKLGGNLFDRSKNNWGPQVGFAWTPKPNSTKAFVLRGGFGLAYDRLEEAITLNGRENPPFVNHLNAVCTDQAQTTCPGLLYRASGSATDIFGYPSNPGAKVPFGSNGLPVNGSPIVVNAYTQNMPTPLSYHFSLGWDYAISPTWVASMGYAGNLSRHYTGQNNLNWIYYPSLNPAVSTFNLFSNNINSSSHALSVELKHTFTHSFQIDTQYRWGKIMDEGSQGYYIDYYPYATKYAHGPADYDMANNFKIFGLWSPNLFPGNKLANKLAGGWQISGILQGHTGFPWTPTYAGTNCNVVYVGSGYCTLRPAAYTGGGNLDRSNNAFKRLGGGFPRGALAYYTVPTFPATGIPPAPGVKRNSLWGPRYLDTDMTLQKTFGLPTVKVLGENAGITIRADAFNLFNNLNFQPDSIDTSISADGVTSNPQFGQAQKALGSRVIEFQARFSF